MPGLLSLSKAPPKPLRTAPFPSAFPHILTRILSHLPPRSPLPLRLLSSTTRDAVDAHLARHLVVHEHRITPEGWKGWHPRLVHLSAEPLRRGYDRLDRAAVRAFVHKHTHVLDFQAAPEPYLVHVLRGAFVGGVLETVRTRVHPPTRTYYEDMWGDGSSQVPGPVLVLRPPRRTPRDPQGRNTPLTPVKYTGVVHVLHLDPELHCAPPRPPARKLPDTQRLVFLLRPEGVQPPPGVTKRPVTDYFAILMRAPPRVAEVFVVNCPPRIRRAVEALVRPHVAGAFGRVAFASFDEYRAEVGEAQFALEREA